MKFGMCGARGFGFDFLRTFDAHPGVERLSFADLDGETRSKVLEQVPNTKGKAYESFDKLIETDIDAIGIFTPPWTHADLTVRALRAGKHVMAACPIGMSLDELRRVKEAVEAMGSIYMSAETSYYYPITLYAKKAYLDGRLGEFVYGEGEYLYRPGAYGFWKRYGYSNMPPMLYATHSVSIPVAVCGQRIEKVACLGNTAFVEEYARMECFPAWKENELSNMTMLGKMSGGGMCRINEMRNVGNSRETGSIYGTLGAVCQNTGGTIWTEGLSLSKFVDLEEEWKQKENHPQTELENRLPESFRGKGMGHIGTHRFLVDEFVRAVNGNRRPHNSFWQSVKYTAPGIVAWESAKCGGEWMEVPDFGEPNDGREPLDY